MRAGGCRGFDIHMPDAATTKAAEATCVSWPRHILGLPWHELGAEGRHATAGTRPNGGDMGDRVPIDPDLADAYARIQATWLPDHEVTVSGMRRGDEPARTRVEDVVTDRPITVEEHWSPGVAGGPGIAIALVRPHAIAPPAPVIFSIHGGGMFMGSRFAFLGELADMAIAAGAVATSVEYRRAPEHPHPAPVEDSYAALCWVADHASGLGLDAERIIVTGDSAGAGIAAGVALAARERGRPSIRGLALTGPMLDDRNDSVSCLQYPDVGPWDRRMNEVGWTALLGAARGGADVPSLAAPAREDDLSGLPPVLIDVGAAEIFRSEAVAFASGIWAAGGQAELHVWAGAFHGFAIAAPGAPVSKAAMAARLSWYSRAFGTTGHRS